MKYNFDKNWVYKNGSEKPPLTCPCCGMRECIYNYSIYNYSTKECYCTFCDSEWGENDEYWDTILGSGTIKEEA